MYAGLNGDPPGGERGNLVGEAPPDYPLLYMCLCGSGPTLTILTQVSLSQVSLAQYVVLDRVCTLGL